MAREKYNKTVWEDNKTIIDSSKLNKIENGLEKLFDTILTPGMINSDTLEIKPDQVTGGVKVEDNSLKIKVIKEDEDSDSPGFIYFVLNSEGKLKKIKYLGEDIYEVG